MKGFSLTAFAQAKQTVTEHNYQISEVANDGSYFIAMRGDGQPTTFYKKRFEQLVAAGTIFNMNDAKGTFSLKVDRNTTVGTTKVDLNA